MHWVLQMGFTSLPWVLQAPAAQANPSPASWRAPIMPDAVRGKQLYEELVAELEEKVDSDALEFVSQLCRQTPPDGEFDSTAQFIPLSVLTTIRPVESAIATFVPSDDIATS